MVNCDKCECFPGSGKIDKCLIPFIEALNNIGLKTIASCCGHGRRPGSIALEDGKEIAIFETFEDARKMDMLFKMSITGEKIG